MYEGGKTCGDRSVRNGAKSVPDGYFMAPSNCLDFGAVPGRDYSKFGICSESKMVCESNTSYLSDNGWIGDKMPLTLCDAMVSPSNSVKPNIVASEFADELNRVLNSAAMDDARPILQCINFVVKG